MNSVVHAASDHHAATASNEGAMARGRKERRWITWPDVVLGRLWPAVAQRTSIAGYGVRRNRGGTAVCKASIAAVLLALGIVALVQEGTNAMIIP